MSPGRPSRSCSRSPPGCWRWPPSLVDHDVWPWRKAHHLGRGHRVRVLVVEELEAAAEAARLGHEALVLGDLQRLRAEAVDVEHVREFAALLELLLGDH